MLLYVGVDSSLLEHVDTTDLAAEAAVHRRLLTVLVAHGVIRFAGEEDQKSLKVKISTLPAPLRGLWMETWSKLGYQLVPPPLPARLDEVQGVQDLAAWAGHIELAVVEPTRGSVLGIPPGSASMCDPTTLIELVRHDLLDESTSLKNSQEFIDRHIPADTDRDLIWTRLFSRLASDADRIVVHDRHIGDALVGRWRAGNSPRGHPTGFEWLLQKIDGSGKSRIHVLTGASRVTPDEVLEALRQVRAGLRAGGIQAFQATVANDAVFMRHSHSRHIRFARRAALLIEPGFSIFGKGRLSQSFPCKRIHIKDAEEKELLVTAEASIIRANL